MVAVDRDELVKCIRASANGGAPGLSGWTGDLMLPLVHSPECMAMFADLIADICNGAIEGEAKEMLLAGRLVPIPKRLDAQGVRPITVSEPFYALAGSYLHTQHGDELADTFEPLQLGVGARGGTERAVHRIQNGLELAQDEAVYLALDSANAFNSVSRAALFTELFKHEQLQRTWRFLHWAYAEPSTLVVMQHGKVAATVASGEGVKQGEPWGGSAYGITAHPLYKAALVAANEHPVEGTAIVDDFGVVGHWQGAFRVFDHVEANGPQVGIHTNRPKCVMLWPHDSAAPAAVIQGCTQRGIQLVVGGVVKTLGAAVGFNTAQLKQFVLEQVNKHNTLFDALQHPAMPLQPANLLFVKCAAPVFGYLQRVMRPSVMQAGAQAFDKALLAAYTTKMGLPALDPSDEAHNITATQVALPVSKSGLGIRRIEETSPAAYFAASVQAAADTWTWIRQYDASERATTALAQELSAVHAELIRKGVKPSAHFPADIDTFFAFFGASNGGAGAVQQKLQRVLMREAEEVSYRRIFDIARPAHKAHLISCCQRNASAWLTAVPTTAALCMANDLFAYATRQRLYLQPADDQPEKCMCGKLLSTDPVHYQGCHYLRPIVTLRHNAVRDKVLHLASQADVIAEREPAHFQHQRPDGTLFFPTGKPVYFDTSITCPSAPSLTAAAQSAMGAARVRERAKNRKFTALCEAEGALFVPVVMETNGGMGEPGDALLTRLSTKSGQPGFKSNAVRQLSVCIQRGNAIVTREGCMRSKRAAVRGRLAEQVAAEELRDAAMDENADRDAAVEELAQPREQRVRDRGQPRAHP